MGRITKRRATAALLLVFLLAASVFSAGPGFLAPHQAGSGSVEGVLEGGNAQVQGALEDALGPVGDPGDAFVDLAGDGALEGSFAPPAPVQGKAIEEQADAPPPAAGIASSFVARAGSPHDALLLASGSASGAALAYDGRVQMPRPAADAAPRSPSAALAMARAFASGSLDLQGDLQAPLLEAAALQGLSLQRVTYTHALGANALEDAILDAHAAVGVRLTPEQRAELRQEAGATEPRLQRATALILYALADAQRTMTRQFEGLTEAERALVRSCTGPSEGPMSFACADPARAALVVEQRLDMVLTAKAALGVLSAVEQALPTLREVAATSLERSTTTTSSGGDPDIFASPGKLVQVGGLGDSLYVGNSLGGAIDSAAQLLTIDLMGNDHYLSRAGGTSPASGLQAEDGGGDDLTFLQAPIQTGLGSLVSLTLDLGGDDTYSGAYGYQGAGLMGIGILLELGGSDSYTATSASQGSANAGIGLLYDLGGNDAYVSQYRSQGFGTTAGIGVLVDSLGGDSYYGNALMQGAGSAQGLGMLLEGDGHDTYRSVSNAPPASQGAGHYGGIGVLVDVRGADQYSCTPSGCQGYVFPGPGVWGAGVGVFLDAGGSDAYSGSLGANLKDWVQGSVGIGSDGQ